MDMGCGCLPISPTRPGDISFRELYQELNGRQEVNNGAIVCSSEKGSIVKRGEKNG